MAPNAANADRAGDRCRPRHACQTPKHLKDIALVVAAFLFFEEHISLILIEGWAVTMSLNASLLVLPTGAAVAADDVARVVAELTAIHGVGRVVADAGLAPADWDKSAYDTALATIEGERAALRAKLADLDRAEAGVRDSLALNLQLVATVEGGRGRDKP